MIFMHMYVDVSNSSWAIYSYAGWLYSRADCRTMATQIRMKGKPTIRAQIIQIAIVNIE